MENFIRTVNDKISCLVWGVPMLVLIISIGIYFTIRTRFFQLRKIKHIWSVTLFSSFSKKKGKNKDKKSISQFQALSAALAATIGTGSIAGVATAITIGGAGSVFWMWISAFVGMMTVYAENVLGIYFRKKNSNNEWIGGAMYYIEHGLGTKWLAVLFSAFCIGASFGMGNMTQANSISAAVRDTFSISPKITGIITALLAGLVIIGGITRIGKFAEVIIPFISVVYVAFSVIIIVINRAMIIPVISSMVKEAFGIKALAGGISGALIKKAVSMGVRRGVFSNEAGLGSSVMVHCASEVKEPAIQGMWGIIEVFIDTFVVCTLTALCILTTGVLGTSTSEGVGLVIDAYGKDTGIVGELFVSISIIIFAFATLIGWSYFGEKATEYIFGRKSIKYYKAIFIVFVFVGAISELNLVWDISDTLNGLMAIPNLIALLLLSSLVIKITENYEKRKIKGNLKLKPLLSAFPDIQNTYQNKETDL